MIEERERESWLLCERVRVRIFSERFIFSSFGPPFRPLCKADGGRDIGERPMPSPPSSSSSLVLAAAKVEDAVKVTDDVGCCAGKEKLGWQKRIKGAEHVESSSSLVKQISSNHTLAKKNICQKSAANIKNATERLSS